MMECEWCYDDAFVDDLCGECFQFKAYAERLRRELDTFVYTHYDQQKYFCMNVKLNPCTVKGESFWDKEWSESYQVHDQIIDQMRNSLKDLFPQFGLSFIGRQGGHLAINSWQGASMPFQENSYTLWQEWETSELEELLTDMRELLSYISRRQTEYEEIAQAVRAEWEAEQVFQTVLKALTPIIGVSAENYAKECQSRMKWVRIVNASLIDNIGSFKEFGIEVESDIGLSKLHINQTTVHYIKWRAE